MERLRCSRRELLALAGATAAGCALSACGSAGTSTRRSEQARTDVAHFRSRPDLRPPLVHATGHAPDGGYVFLTPGGPMIVDPGGELVWNRRSTHAAMNLRVQRYRREPVLTWWEGTIRDGVGDHGEVTVLDSRYREITRIVAAKGLRTDFHEFVVAPDGTGYLTAYEKVRADLSAIGGPARSEMLDAHIQGIDLATGDLVFEWRSSRHIGLSETYRSYSPGSLFTPVHLNSIDVLPDGNLLVSARHTWTVYKIDRASGEILWRLGGKKSDFSLGTGAHFAWQHDARWHSGNVLSMFDNESAPPEASQSRGLVVHVTEGKKAVTFRHAYYFPGEQLLSGSQGSVQFMPGGDVFVGWGSQPYFTQYRHDGRAVLDGSFEKGSSYRAFRVPWTGIPTDRPAIAVERRGGDALRVYASWNGATEVARWSVLGSSGAGGLSELVAVARSGFETAIDVSTPPAMRFVAARALGRSGDILGTSRVEGT
ncbi:MAG: arylsulfotransferase family protein [Acidimicrobiales bacterium]